MYIAIGLCGYLDQQDQLIIGDSILNIKPIIRCRTIVKLCVAVNVTLFHREFNVESTLLWLSSIKVAKMNNDNKKSHPPSTVYYSPSVIGGLTAFTKILFTFCSFFGEQEMVAAAKTNGQRNVGPDVCCQPKTSAPIPPTTVTSASERPTVFPRH
ncbi:hypothetical protein ACI65C_006601 [Semiaphis heraclei]